MQGQLKLLVGPVYYDCFIRVYQSMMYVLLVNFNGSVKSGRALATPATPSEPPLVHTMAHSGITKVGHWGTCPIDFVFSPYDRC